MRTPEFLVCVRGGEDAFPDGENGTTLTEGDILMVIRRDPPLGSFDGAEGAFDPSAWDEMPLTGVRGIARAVDDHVDEAADAGEPLRLARGCFVELLSEDDGVAEVRRRGIKGKVPLAQLEVVLRRSGVEDFEFSGSESDEEIIVDSDSNSDPHSDSDSEPDTGAGGEPGGGGATVVRALYDYVADEEGELTLKEGDVVVVTEKDDDWWTGYLRDGPGPETAGMFPANYVEVVEDSSPPAKTEGGGSSPQGGVAAVALYDYAATDVDELSFSEGALLTVTDRSDNGWWYGYLTDGGDPGKPLMFPAAYVKVQDPPAAGAAETSGDGEAADEAAEEAAPGPAAGAGTQDGEGGDGAPKGDADTPGNERSADDAAREEEEANASTKDDTASTDKEDGEEPEEVKGEEEGAEKEKEEGNEDAEDGMSSSEAGVEDAAATAEEDGDEEKDGAESSDAGDKAAAEAPAEDGAASAVGDDHRPSASDSDGGTDASDATAPSATESGTRAGEDQPKEPSVRDGGDSSTKEPAPPSDDGHADAAAGETSAQSNDGASEKEAPRDGTEGETSPTAEDKGASPRSSDAGSSIDDDVSSASGSASSPDEDASAAAASETGAGGASDADAAPAIVGGTADEGDPPAAAGTEKDTAAGAGDVAKDTADEAAGGADPEHSDPGSLSDASASSSDASSSHKGPSSSNKGSSSSNKGSSRRGSQSSKGSPSNKGSSRRGSQSSKGSPSNKGSSRRGSQSSKASSSNKGSSRRGSQSSKGSPSNKEGSSRRGSQSSKASSSNKGSSRKGSQSSKGSPSSNKGSSSSSKGDSPGQGAAAETEEQKERAVPSRSRSLSPVLTRQESPEPGPRVVSPELESSSSEDEEEGHTQGTVTLPPSAAKSPSRKQSQRAARNAPAPSRARSGGRDRGGSDPESDAEARTGGRATAPGGTLRIVAPKDVPMSKHMSEYRLKKQESERARDAAAIEEILGKHRDSQGVDARAWDRRLHTLLSVGGQVISVIRTDAKRRGQPLPPKPARFNPNAALAELPDIDQVRAERRKRKEKERLDKAIREATVRRSQIPDDATRSSRSRARARSESGGGGAGAAAGTSPAGSSSRRSASRKAGPVTSRRRRKLARIQKPDPPPPTFPAMAHTLNEIRAEIDGLMGDVHMTVSQRRAVERASQNLRRKLDGFEDPLLNCAEGPRFFAEVDEYLLEIPYRIVRKQRLENHLRPLLQSLRKATTRLRRAVHRGSGHHEAWIAALQAAEIVNDTGYAHLPEPRALLRELYEATAASAACDMAHINFLKRKMEWALANPGTRQRTPVFLADVRAAIDASHDLLRSVDGGREYMDETEEYVRSTAQHVHEVLKVDPSLKAIAVVRSMARRILPAVEVRRAEIGLKSKHYRKEQIKSLGFDEFQYINTPGSAVMKQNKVSDEELRRDWETLDLAYQTLTREEAEKCSELYVRTAMGIADVIPDLRADHEFLGRIRDNEMRAAARGEERGVRPTASSPGQLGGAGFGPRPAAGVTSTMSSSSSSFSTTSSGSSPSPFSPFAPSSSPSPFSPRQGGRHDGAVSGTSAGGSASSLPFPSPSVYSPLSTPEAKKSARGSHGSWGAGSLGHHRDEGRSPLRRAATALPGIRTGRAQSPTQVDPWGNPVVRTPERGGGGGASRLGRGGSAASPGTPPGGTPKKTPGTPTTPGTPRTPGTPKTPGTTRTAHFGPRGRTAPGSMRDGRAISLSSPAKISGSTTLPPPLMTLPPPRGAKRERGPRGPGVSKPKPRAPPPPPASSKPRKAPAGTVAWGASAGPSPRAGPKKKKAMVFVDIDDELERAGGDAAARGTPPRADRDARRPLVLFKKSKLTPTVTVDIEELWAAAEPSPGSPYPLVSQLRSESRWRSVRVFVSHDPVGFDAEAGMLARDVFPRLVERARALRVHLSFVDPRVGLPASTFADPSSIDVCLRELDRCRDEGDTPILISLLGDRYGWVPGHHEVPAEARTRTQWVDGMNPVAMEVVHGAYRERSATAFFCLRDPAFTDDARFRALPDEVHQRFLDVRDKIDPAGAKAEAKSEQTARWIDAAQSHRATTLKERVRAMFGPRGQVLEYAPVFDSGTAAADEDGSLRGPVELSGLAPVAKFVEEAVWTTIEARYPLDPEFVAGPDPEMEDHSEPLGAPSSFPVCVGRAAELDALESHCMGSSGSAMAKVVVGPAGSGKTTLLRMLGARLAAGGRSAPAVYLHGRPLFASTATGILAQLCHSLARWLSLPPPEPKRLAGDGGDGAEGTAAAAVAAADSSGSSGSSASEDDGVDDGGIDDGGEDKAEEQGSAKGDAAGQDDPAGKDPGDADAGGEQTPRRRRRRRRARRRARVADAGAGGGRSPSPRSSTGRLGARGGAVGGKLGTLLRHAAHPPTDLSKLTQLLADLVSRASRRRPVTVLVDGIDRIPGSEVGRLIRAVSSATSELAQKHPARVVFTTEAIGVAALRSGSLAAVSLMRELGKWFVGAHADPVRLGPLPPDALRETLAAALLSRHGRKLEEEITADQVEIAASRNVSGSPLWCSLAADEIASFGFFEGHRHRTGRLSALPSDVGGMLEMALERAEARLGVAPVADVLVFLAHARNGLLEEEVRELLGGCPVAAWGALVHELSWCLTPSPEGTLTLSCGAALLDLVRTRYLAGDADGSDGGSVGRSGAVSRRSSMDLVSYGALTPRSGAGLGRDGDDVYGDDGGDPRSSGSAPTSFDVHRRMATFFRGRAEAAGMLDTQRVDADSQSQSAGGGGGEPRELREMQFHEALGVRMEELSTFVAVRVRPMTTSERRNGAHNCVSMRGCQVLLTDPRDGSGALRTYVFSLDAALWSYSRAGSSGARYADQEASTVPFAHFAAENVAAGYSVTLIAFGQDGTGKSHTLFGAPGATGIAGRVITQVFRGASRAGAEVDVSLSAYEVVGEHLHDLVAGRARGAPIRVREDARRRIFVDGASTQRVHGEAQLREALSRLVAAAKSRREPDYPTHVVIPVTVRQRIGDEVVTTRITLCELAGSLSEVERVHGQRPAGRIAVNKSLTIFSRCLLTMTAGETPPYRDSTLTLLLRDTFIGRAKIALLGAISPSHMTFKDSLITLQLARNVRGIHVDPKINVSIARSGGHDADTHDNDADFH